MSFRCASTNKAPDKDDAYLQAFQDLRGRRLLTLLRRLFSGARLTQPFRLSDPGVRREERRLVFDIPTRHDVAGEVDELGVGFRSVAGGQGGDSFMELRREEVRQRRRRFEELFEDRTVARC